LLTNDKNASGSNQRSLYSNNWERDKSLLKPSFQSWSQRVYQVSIENQKNKEMKINTEEQKVYHDNEWDQYQIAIQQAYLQDISDVYAEETFEKNQSQIESKSNFNQKDDSVNADFVISTIKSTTTKVYKHCDQSFESENKLHCHLEKCSTVRSINESAAFSVTSKSSSKKKRILIESSSKSLQIIDYVFRDWQYVTVKVCWSLNESEEDIVLDTECIMTIANHKFIEFIASNTSIQKMTSLISVWDIENKIHHFSDFVMLITYIHEFLSDDKLTTTCFRQEIHLINDFRVKILLEIDIMTIKKMQLDLNEKIVRINSCQEFTVNIFVLTRNLSNLKRIV